MQKGIWAVVLIILAGSVWWHLDRTRALAESAPPPKPIVFDNDNASPRPAEPPAQPAAPQPSAQAKAQALPYGSLRKCVRGEETTYTNDYCPSGFKEKTVDSKQMTVVSGAGKTNSAAVALPVNPQ